MDLLSYEQLTNDLATIRAEFESRKAEQVELLELEKQQLVDSFAGAIASEIPAKISQLTALESKLIALKDATIETVKPQNVILFNNKLYLPQKNTVSRIKGVGRFQIGSTVKLSYQGIEDSKTYRVTESSKIIDIVDGKQYVPSILTEKFHVEQLGRTPSNKGMAGLSHPYWIQVVE